MTQVNGLPDEHREIKPLQDSSQNPATPDVSEVDIFGDAKLDENLPYLPISGVKDPESDAIMLDEIVVTAKAPPKQPIRIPTINVNIPEKIDLKADMRMSAADLVETYGGKFQKREVNGQKQDIVIVKFGKAQYKFAVTDDGFLGEELITVSTFGKNKYITKSEHERRMEEIFHGPVPEGIDVDYAYENGTAYPIFTKDGKRLSSKELRDLVPKKTDNDDKPNNEEIENSSVDENVDNTDSEENRRRNLYKNTLESKTLTNSSGENLITPEILALFNDGDTDIDYKDLIDETGNLKPEFKLFDLNDDGKFDINEKEFFSSGGHIASKQTVNVSLDNFIKAVMALDSFDLNESGSNFPDGKVNANSALTLYSMLRASHSLLKKLDYLPEEVQQKYSEALEQVSLHLVNPNVDDRLGQYSADRIGVNRSKTKSIQMLESILLHELTHHILSNDLNMSSDMLQEVEAFYMQYKFYCANKENHPNNPRLLQNSTIEAYALYADELKAKKPKISEKELALKSFLKIYFDKYKEQYSLDISKRNLKQQAKKTDFLYLK